MDKETAIENFFKIIKESWTYARLTEEEKIRFVNFLYSEQTEKCIKGTYQQRWKILHAIYTSFLMALDYKPIGWREEDIPKF